MAKEKQINDTLDFINNVVEQERKNYQHFFVFLSKFTEMYRKVENEFPPSYQLNVIDELHADENAHSRIFAEILKYEGSDEKNKYPFLKKFLNDECKFNVTVIKPEIGVDNCGRIDISISDNQYFIIIENKVTDKAPDQNNKKGGQLARYIENVIRNERKKTEEIFVVYTPKYTRMPSNECWKNKDDKSYKNDFKNRFRSISYREGIYPMLKNKILPSIDEKDIYFRSGVVQYVDYLEGMFNIRNINKKMNMEIQKFIRKELGLNELVPEIALKILSEKRQEMENVINQLDSLQEEIQKEIDEKYFSNCFVELEKLNLNVVQKIEGYEDDYFPARSVGVNLVDKLTIWIGRNEGDNEVFCQLNCTNHTKEIPQKFINKFQEIVGGEASKKRDYIEKRFENRNHAFISLKEFCKKMDAIKK